MYLLKQLQIREYIEKMTVFTFHHVSIKTKKRQIINGRRNVFTFHHVSIKTHRRIQ